MSWHIAVNLLLLTSIVQFPRWRRLAAAGFALSDRLPLARTDCVASRLGHRRLACHPAKHLARDDLCVCVCVCDLASLNVHRACTKVEQWVDWEWQGLYTTTVPEQMPNEIDGVTMGKVPKKTRQKKLQLYMLYREFWRIA